VFLSASSGVARPGQPTAVGPERRALAAYLRAQSPVVQAAVDAHRSWTAALPALAPDAGRPRPDVARDARALGAAHAPSFARLAAEARLLAVPAPAAQYHNYLVRWLDHLVSAAQALTQAPADGQDRRYLRDCHDFLADARSAAQPLNQLRLLLHEAATGQR
jgi:hypothetical protein